MMNLYEDSPGPLAASLVLRHGARRWFLDRRLVAHHLLLVSQLCESCCKSGDERTEVDLSEFRPDWARLLRRVHAPERREEVRPEDVVDFVVRRMYGLPDGEASFEDVYLLEASRFLGYQAMTLEVERNLADSVPAQPVPVLKANPIDCDRVKCQLKTEENRLVYLVSISVEFGLDALWAKLLARNNTQDLGRNPEHYYTRSLVGEQVGRVGRLLFNSKVFSDARLLAWYGSFFGTN